MTAATVRDDRELEQLCALLTSEVRVAREASDITARLVVAQFAKMERIQARLERTAADQKLLRAELQAQLVEVERRGRELAEARALAHAANRAKSTFLANMSHELRTPLNAIIGYSELLMEEAEDLEPEEFVPDLDKIRAAGKHLLALINDVLDLSKIEAGKMQLYLEDFELRELLQDVLATAMPLAQRKHNTLTAEIALDATMHSDLTRVRQCLFNLLSNAAKFTDSGAITLRATRTHEAGVDMVAIEVADEGIGMTAEQLGRLFQPFSQADASTTRRFGGTGLGLAITRRICRMLGGHVGVRSEPGVGSLFTVTLPLDSRGRTRPDDKA